MHKCIYEDNIGYVSLLVQDNSHKYDPLNQVLQLKLKVPVFILEDLDLFFYIGPWSEVYLEDSVPELYLPSKFSEPENEPSSDPEISSVFGENLVYTKYASGEVRECTGECVRVYRSLLDRGIEEGQARMVLPGNMYKEYHVVAKISEVEYFIETRTGDNTLYEIRRVAEAMRECLDNVKRERSNA